MLSLHNASYQTQWSRFPSGFSRFPWCHRMRGGGFSKVRPPRRSPLPMAKKRPLKVRPPARFLLSIDDVVEVLKALKLKPPRRANPRRRRYQRRVATLALLVIVIGT